MKITRDVITDLLPAYLADEASADTRALVQEVLAENAEFARIVSASKAGSSDALLTPTPNLSPDVERDALARTRALVRRRTMDHRTRLVLYVPPVDVRVQRRASHVLDAA